MKTTQELIAASESMTAEERAYWLEILPTMTQDQHVKFRKILTDEADALAAIEEKYGPIMLDEAKVKHRLEHITILES